MTLADELKRIAELNDADRSKDALSALERLERAHPGNPELIWQRVLTLWNLERYADARAEAEKLVGTRGSDPEFWQTCSELREGDHTAALADIERGLSVLPENEQLLQSKAVWLGLLGRIPEATAIYDRLVAQQPGEVDMLLARAGFLEQCATDETDDKAIVVDAMGIKYSASYLERAIDDYTAAIALQGDWKVHVRRAGCLRRLGREQEALTDYDAALAALGPDSPQSDLVLEERRGPRAKIHESLARTRAELRSGGQMTLQGQMAESMIDSIADQVGAGSDLASALGTFISEDPDDIAAINVARQMLKVGSYPAPDLQAVDPRDFPDYMRRHCDYAQRQLEGAGFRPLGDYEAVHLTPGIGQRVLLRCFVSRDGAACASAYALRPLWPGWVAWLVLLVTGKWKTMRVVDCESEFSNGSFLMTTNTGALGELEYGNVVMQNILPAGTAIREVVARHAVGVDEIRAEAGEVQRLGSFDDLLAMQTRMQAAKNDYRRSVGYATDSDLRRHLGGHYDRLSGKVRAKLDAMAGAVQTVLPA